MTQTPPPSTAIETVSELTDERLQALRAEFWRQSSRRGIDIFNALTELQDRRRSLDTADGVEPVLRKALEGVRANLIRLAWEENSVMIEGIDKALASRPTRNAGVGVKALDWARGSGNALYAYILNERYSVHKHKGKYILIINSLRQPEEYDTEQAGVTAAQADFNQRIRSALASPPSPAEVSDELRRVAEKMLAYRNVEYVPNVLFEQLEEALQLVKEG